MKAIFRTCIPAISLAALVSAQQHYRITDLKPLQGGNFSQAFSVNNIDLIGGQSNITDPTQRAVIWVKGWLNPILIATPTGVNSAIFGINEKGLAEVQSEVSETDPNTENFCGYGTDRKCLPFAWRNNTLTPLPLLGGNNGAVGGINNRGEISGWAEDATIDPECAAPQKLDFEAVVWKTTPGAAWGTKPIEMRRLRRLSEDTVSMSISINDRGEAVGTSGSCADTGLLPLGHGAHAVLWDENGSPLNIGELDPDHEFGGIALSINNKSQVVGGANQPGGSSLPFLWSRRAGVRMLGLLPGGVGGGAVGINDQGDAVGQSFDADGVPSPVLWRDGGSPKNLNDLAPHSPLYLLWPTAINAQGEISGFGVTSDGDIHGFLATPHNAKPDEDGCAVDGNTRPPVLTEHLRRLMGRRFEAHRR
jgi:uncharacterized membrane protein